MCQWKLGRFSEVFPGEDGKACKVHFIYKNLKLGEPVEKFSGRGYVTVERVVNKKVLVLPVDEKEDSS